MPALVVMIVSVVIGVSVNDTGTEAAGHDQANNNQLQVGELTGRGIRNGSIFGSGIERFHVFQFLSS